MDELLQCALAYKRLLDIAYHFKIARKGVAFSFDLVFEKEDFHHLLGLHKLKDNDKIRTGNRAKIFDDILKGKITYTDIQKSAFFGEMENRIDPVTNLEMLLDSDNMVFRFNRNQTPYSKIVADYILECNGEGVIYVFTKSVITPDKMKCISVFPKSTLDYTKGQPKYTILSKDKLILQQCE